MFQNFSLDSRPKYVMQKLLKYLYPAAIAARRKKLLNYTYLIIHCFTLNRLIFYF